MDYLYQFTLKKESEFASYFKCIMYLNILFPVYPVI